MIYLTTAMNPIASTLINSDDTNGIKEISPKNEQQLTDKLNSYLKLKEPAKNNHNFILVNVIISIILIVLMSIFVAKDPEAGMEVTSVWTIRHITAELVKGVFNKLPNNIYVTSIITILFFAAIIISILFYRKYPERAWDIIGESVIRALVYTIFQYIILYIFKLLNQ